MNKTIVLIWGLVTILPFIFFLYMTLTMFGMEPSDHEAFELQFDFIFKLGMWVNGVTMVLLVSYLVYLFKTSRVPKDKKALWAVVLFMGHAISMPIFWYIYIWSPTKKGTGHGV